MSHINNEPENLVSGFAGSLDCDWPAGAMPSAFRQTDIWAMAFDNLVRWISKGVTPPRSARIELEADGRTVKRDGNENALGGVRSVFVDVPTESIMATSLAPGGVVRNPCAYAGYQHDFSTEKPNSSTEPRRATCSKWTRTPGGSSANASSSPKAPVSSSPRREIRTSFDDDGATLGRGHHHSSANRAPNRRR
jgi:Alpha/beta hydrolase domain